jgi:hypothetical protein
MGQKHQIHLANFDKATLRVIWFRWARLWVAGRSKWVEPERQIQQPADAVMRPAIRHVPRSVVRIAHERIVRCGLGIFPVSSKTEDKFKDAMEVTASSPLPEIARVLLRFNHVAGIIVNANHSIM